MKKCPTGRIGTIAGALILTNGTDDDPLAGMQLISEVVIELFKRDRSPSPAEPASRP